MSCFYEDTYKIDSRDVDAQDQCRPSAILGLLQEAATEAAVALRVSGPEIKERYQAIWMLARVWYHLDRPLHWKEELCIRTWHRGGKGAAMYRDFDLKVDGKPVGEAVSTWVMADVESRRLLRFSAMEEFRDTDGGTLCKDILLHRPKLPAEMALAEERLMHYSDCDINGHVNNARYADFTCDALKMETRKQGKFVSQLQVGYLHECHPGEQVLIYTGAAEDRLCVRGVGSDEVPRFDAALTLSPIL